MSGNYSLVQECTDSYETRDLPDGRMDVHIVVPRRFADLWLAKLSSLRTDDEEIRQYQPEGP
jgi:hypothetical protein